MEGSATRDSGAAGFSLVAAGAVAGVWKVQILKNSVFVYYCGFTNNLFFLQYIAVDGEYEYVDFHIRPYENLMNELLTG